MSRIKSFKRLSIQRDLTTSKRVVILTSVLFLFLLLWQTYSASSIHQRYQESLMDSITDHILTDYQEYFNQLQLEINLFQQKHRYAIERLRESGIQASESEYMAVLTSLRAEIKHTRLFALIGNEGEGVLSHITGELMPACKEEVMSTLEKGSQENLFLHRSSSSVHFDLLQPLVSQENDNKYFFVAFNTDVLKQLLVKYQLPHQQLFLMRSDNIGKIELTGDDSENSHVDMVMTSEELSRFSFVKDIPRTRWQVAIRLDENYNANIYLKGVIKALIIWTMISVLIYIYYRSQKNRLATQNTMAKALSFKDSHDKLTGLANRERFSGKLSQLLHLKINENQSDIGAALHIDIDNFKVINQSYGYMVGDRILFHLAQVLKEYLPEDATVSRLGSDEFAVLLPSIEHAHIKDIAHEVRQLIQQKRISELNKETELTASIGAVIFDGSQIDVEQVLSSMSLSVALAKQKGGNRVILYQSEDVQLQQHANEMDAIHLLSEAIKENRLMLYRQEIRALNTTYQKKHYEVLVRMKGPTGDVVYPGAFIPAAEKYALIKQLDRIVINMTLQAISEEDEDSSYSINLSGTSLADRDIFEYMHGMFAKHNVDPKRICFEITETSAISHLNSALKFIEQMTEIGCQFSLDDFGSGLSSFSYLQKLPVSIIKIDGIFVRDIHENNVNRIFVENIQRTAVAMNIRTVAEFVESDEIEQLLKAIGVDFVQGYYIHKPEPWYVDLSI